MEVSIIIPALNEEKNIENCLKSVINQTLPREKYEVIVSDSNSTDNTVKIARRYADKVIATKRRGVWYGRNFGANSARGKYLIFIDADTTIDQDYLETVSRYLNLGYVCVSCGFRLSSKRPEIKARELFENTYHLLINRLGVPCFLGFNLCMPKRIFRQIGGFKNEPLEDNILGKEASNFGKTIFLPRRKVTTSSRRLEEMGTLGSLMYYLELWLISHKIVKGNNALIKYKNYRKVR